MNQLLKGLELELNDENELEELIKQFDIDGDGYISLIEFLKLVKNLKFNFCWSTSGFFF